MEMYLCTIVLSMPGVKEHLNRTFPDTPTSLEVICPVGEGLKCATCLGRTPTQIFSEARLEFKTFVIIKGV